MILVMETGALQSDAESERKVIVKLPGSSAQRENVVS